MFSKPTSLSCLFTFLVAAGASSAWAAAQCPAGTRLEGEMCIYDRNTQGSALGCHKTVTRIVGFGQQAQVPTVQRGLECYEPPPPGYGWTTPGGILIGKVCPPGSADTGTTCHYDRGPGKPLTFEPCPAGYREAGVVCTRDVQREGKWRVSGWNGGCNPDEQRRCDGVCGASMVSCSRQCKPGWRDDGTACWLDVDTKTRKGACGSDEQIGLLCYPRARAGFKCFATACNFGKDVKPGTRVGMTTMACPPPPAPPGYPPAVWAKVAAREEIAGLCYPAPKPGFSCSTPNRCFAYLKDLPTRKR
jgi:hypothetical protein